MAKPPPRPCCAYQQVTLPHLLPLQMASAQTQQCGSPLHTGQIGQQTFVKTTVNPATFPSCDVCCEKNQDFCFMGCTILEATKNPKWLTSSSPSLSLLHTHTHTHTHTHRVLFQKKKKNVMISLMFPQGLQIMNKFKFKKFYRYLSPS